VYTSTNYTMSSSDDMVVGTSSLPITVTLPNASTVKSYYFQNFGTGEMRLQTVSSQLINSDTNLILKYKHSSCRLVANGTKFMVL
jgi:hypothetical protein